MIKSLLNSQTDARKCRTLAIHNMWAFFPHSARINSYLFRTYEFTNQTPQITEEQPVMTMDKAQEKTVETQPARKCLDI